jgi:hypothetical protein
MNVLNDTNYEIHLRPVQSRPIAVCQMIVSTYNIDHTDKH